ncbi:DUF2948 family protein [Albirhodobacter sp. R86504]|uniref:DUF2948 family protein n=1 Tax=Albirhodobacter sp. R86504 TaxID=3093848 RepID=UPI00366D5056
MADARFEEGESGALALMAQEADDLAVVSTLVQDAVLTAADMRWDAKARRLVLLLNRFRWEDRAAATLAGRPYERVRSLLIISDVSKIAAQGIDKGDSDTVLSLLGLFWEPGEDGTGRVILTFAGDGALAISAECLNIDLRDVTRPYIAPSGKVPDHGEI